MTINQVINKYRDIVKDFTADLDDKGEGLYFIELKKPYANNQDAPAYITDLITAESPKEADSMLKRFVVKLKPDDWDKMYNEDFSSMSEDPYDRN